MAMAQRAAPAARADRRKAESRQKLVAAARQLFIERGYDATRPQDIARAADVGYGTFYLYFADKRDCFLAFAEAARSELAGFVSERLAGIEGVEPQLRALLEELVDFAERNPGVLKAAMADISVVTAGGPPAVSLVDRWAAEWAAQIRAGARAGAIHADYDAEVAGHAIVGLIRGAADCARNRRAVLIDTVARFLTRALVPEGAGETARHHRFISGEGE